MHSVRFFPARLIIAFLLISLQPLATAGADPAAMFNGTLRIGGTGSALATITQMAAAYGKKHPQVCFVIPPSLGSTGGIKAVLAGALDVGLSSRPLTPEEDHRGAVALEYVRTPFLLVTSYNGAGVNFTLKQIASLYAGEVKSFPDGTPIRIIIRPEIDTDTLFIRSLSPEMAEAVRQAQSRQGMIMAITDQENGDVLEKTMGALGWMTLAQIVSESRSVTLLPIDNISPSPENFMSGKYPYFKPFYVVTRAKPGALATSFIKFLTSAEGRAILLKNGQFVNAVNP